VSQALFYEHSNPDENASMLLKETKDLGSANVYINMHLIYFVYINVLHVIIGDISLCALL
jgi:hypothetical protein